MFRILWGSLLGVVTLVAVVSAPAGSVPAQTSKLHPVTAPAVSPESEQRLRKAFNHLYNMEFKFAYRLFEQVAKDEPESATVRAFWASAVLYEILAQQGSLQTQLFVTSNKFLKHQRVPPDPRLNQTFHRLIKEAEELAERRLEANEQDVDGLFALGTIYGCQANYLAGVEEEYFKGVRKGQKAYDLHKKLHELHPEINDTAVVRGIHNYIIGSLPRLHRIFLFFVGASGDRERGVQYLHEAATRGEFLRTYAKMLVGVAYVREGQLELALENVKELRAEYPRNPMFTLEQVRLHRKLEQYAEGKLLCEQLVGQLLAHPPNPGILGPEDALLELGKLEQAEGKLKRALQTWQRIGHLPEVNKRIWAQALLERGKIYDQLSQRKKALAEYEKVVQLAAYPEATRLALGYKNEPYRPEGEESN